MPPHRCADDCQQEALEQKPGGSKSTRVLYDSGQDRGSSDSETDQGVDAHVEERVVLSSGQIIVTCRYFGGAEGMR